MAEYKQTTKAKLISPLRFWLQALKNKMLFTLFHYAQHNTCVWRLSLLLFSGSVIVVAFLRPKPSSLKVEAIQEVGLSEQEEEITESIKTKSPNLLYIKVASFLTILGAIKNIFH